MVVALLPVTLALGCSGSSGTPAAAPPASATPTTSVAPPAQVLSPSPSAPPAPATAAVCSPAPFTATTALKTTAPIGGQLGMKSVAAGLHPCYDRVVFTLGGTAVAKPGWRVEYVATPTSDGSGNPVAVTGSAFLRVVITNVGIPPDTGVPDPSPKQISPTSTLRVRQVVLDTAFEGQYTAFIGLTGVRPFRVFRLSSPARVVVDIRHT
jgi:hypothetical protein